MLSGATIGAWPGTCPPLLLPALGAARRAQYMLSRDSCCVTVVLFAYLPLPLLNPPPQRRRAANPYDDASSALCWRRRLSSVCRRLIRSAARFRLPRAAPQRSLHLPVPPPTSPRRQQPLRAASGHRRVRRQRSSTSTKHPALVHQLDTSSPPLLQRRAARALDHAMHDVSKAVSTALRATTEKLPTMQSLST